MDWTGGPSNPSIRAGHLPASSLINRLSTSVTSCPFPCAPDCCRRHHPPLPVCLSVILPFVPIYLPLPAVCLAENRRLLPSPVHCIRARTRANNHYAPNILVSRAATILRHRLPDHLRDESPRRSRNRLQRGARLLAHRIPRWLRAAAPMLVRPDRHLGASQG